MPSPSADLSKQALQAFPPWLDLPPGYIVNDWIAWEKGKLVAARLREKPELVKLGIAWLEKHRERWSAHEQEWFEMLTTWPLQEVIALLKSGSPEGQRLRSGMPFKGEPFTTRAEMDAIHERAYRG